MSLRRLLLYLPIIIATGAAFLLAAPAPGALAGSVWQEDWLSHCPGNNCASLDQTQPPSTYWNFHTYNLYPDPNNPGAPPSTDSFSLTPNPNDGGKSNILNLTGNGWGLESKQHFQQGAPLSIECAVQLDQGLDTQTGQPIPSMAGITIYDGEGGEPYEEFSLEDHTPVDGNGLQLYRRTESTAYSLPSGGGLTNANLDHNANYTLRLDYDGQGTWRYYAYDQSGKGGLLATITNRYLSGAPDIFILGVAWKVGTDSKGNPMLVEPLGDPEYQVRAHFQKITVQANYNLFSESTWVDFMHSDPYSSANSPNTYLNMDTQNGEQVETPDGPKYRCPWYDPKNIPNAKWPQCDFIELAHTDPNNLDSAYDQYGDIITPTITLPAPGPPGSPVDNWGEVQFTDTLGGVGTDLYIQVLDGSGNPIPDSDLPGNGAGFRSSPIRLGWLDTAKYPAIKLKAYMSTSNPSISPSLYDWTLTFGSRSYFTWYDMQSYGMKDWLMMSDGADYSTSAHFQAQLGQRDAGPDSYNVANPGSSAAQTWSGTSDGPLMVNSLSGLPQVISQRVLFGDSLEETVSVPNEKLSSRYYWTWYDMQSPGYKDWIMVANPSYTDPVYYEITIPGDPGVDPATTPGASGVIGPGGHAAPMFPGVIGGPVQVQAWSDSTKTTPAKVMASQRVLMFSDTAFNEVNGVAQEDLKSDYLWTWYDMQAAGASDWVMIANPADAGGPIYYEVWIAGKKVKDGGPIAPGGNDTPTFPRTMDGPVEVKTFSDPGHTIPANSITSQRTLWSNSFEEVPGFIRDSLSNNYNWTWYDTQSAGASDWVLVANPGSSTIYFEISIGGVRRYSGTLDPGKEATPAFPDLMAGPVQVKAWTDSSKNTTAPVFASQRVLWSNHLNEVVGTPLG